MDQALKKVNRFIHLCVSSSLNENASYEQKQCLNPSDGDLVNLALDLLSIPRTDNTRSNMAVCIEMLKLKRELKDHSIQSKSLSLNAPENRERLSNLQKGIVDTYQHAVDQCRKSLNFKSRGLTEEKVETADEDTCQWIHKNNEFDTWLGGEQPLLWIKGRTPFYSPIQYTDTIKAIQVLVNPF